MSSKRITLINLLLIFLVVLDIVLSTLTILFPNTWFKIMHGIAYVDAQGVPADFVGLLKRTGAVWVAFTLFQLIAYLRWRTQSYWLTVVAGIRLTEVFSDWTYILAAHPYMTWFGYLALFIAPPANLFFGWFLINSYLKINRET